MGLLINMTLDIVEGVLQTRRGNAATNSIGARLYRRVLSAQEQEHVTHAGSMGLSHKYKPRCAPPKNRWENGLSGTLALDHPRQYMYARRVVGKVRPCL